MFCGWSPIPDIDVDVGERYTANDVPPVLFQIVGAFTVFVIVKGALGLLVPIPKLVPVNTNADPVAKALVLDAYTTPFAVNDVRFVPPFATGSVPVTPVVKGNPVLLANDPVVVCNVPLVGKVKLVLPVAVNVCVNAPEWVTLPANVSVAEPLFTPVPPTADVNGPLIIVLVTVAVSPVVTIVPVTAGTATVKLDAVFGPLSAT